MFCHFQILDAQKLIDDAVELYGGNSIDPVGKSLTENFKRESVSTTSMYFAKATVQFVMYETNIIEFVENAAASVYECPIQ